MSTASDTDSPRPEKTKAVGPLADILTGEEWEVFSLAAHQGWLTVMVVITQEMIDKLAAGRGEVVGMSQQKMVVALVPMGGIVAGYEKHQPSDVELGMMVQAHGEQGK